MNTLTSSIPQLHPVTLTDWLEKLGEKALLSWLQLHSWKTNTVNMQQPYCFRYSLNQLIKKLKMGKATFYKKILGPLVQYGLISLKPTEQANRETHLILYFYPQNCQEKASQPLSPVSIEDKDCKPQDTPPSLPPTNQQPDEKPSSTDSSPKEPSPPQNEPLLKKLPEPLQTSIHSNPTLMNYLPNILTVYQRVQNHPYYSHPSFLKKLEICIKYAPDPKNFSAYFQKALLNEWNQLQPQPPRPSIQTPFVSPRSSDVPEWIWKQQERKENDLPEESNRLNSEQQAIIDDLLRQMGELGHGS